MDEALLTRALSREVDRTLAAAGVPGVVLMENAGRGAAERVLARAPSMRRAVVLAGAGNNGGDGFVVARHLALHRPGADVLVACAVDPAALRGDAAVMRDAWRAVGGATLWVRDEASRQGLLEGCDVVVDALFGTGLTRPLDGAARALVELANARRPGLAVALDVPSGVDVDTGAVLGEVAFQAQLTCTFGTSKPGLHTGDGLLHAGEVEVVPLGAPVPDAVRAQAPVWRSAWVPPLPRRADAHKGSAGRVLVIAGSPGKVGAALLAARGAHRAGAGLVTVASRCAAALDARVLETMTLALPDDLAALEVTLRGAFERADAVAIGPGLGLDAHALRCVELTLAYAACPVVVDADALTLHPRACAATGAWVAYTPHPVELCRLRGGDPATDLPRVMSDRIGAARACASHVGGAVLLKGAGTVVAWPSGEARVLPYAEPVLGVAGSGDVLAGVAAARLAEARRAGADLDAAFVGAAHLHARAGGVVRRELGGARGALASEIADAVARAW